MVFGQNDKPKISCYSKLDTLTQQQVYRSVDKMPEVKGGFQELSNEVYKTIKWPPNEDKPLDTKIIVAFVVQENGQISGKRVIKNIAGTNFADQLLKIIGELKWSPGTCNGKAVPTLYLFPMILEFK